MKVTAKGMMGLENYIGDSPTATHAFAGGSPFTVAGPAPGTALVIGAGLSVALNQSTSLDLDYHGSLGSGSSSHALTLTLSGTF